jgi:hypothetical protein
MFLTFCSTLAKPSTVPPALFGLYNVFVLSRSAVPRESSSYQLPNDTHSPPPLTTSNPSSLEMPPTDTSMSKETTRGTRKCEKSSTSTPMHAGVRKNAKNAYICKSTRWIYCYRCKAYLCLHETLITGIALHSTKATPKPVSPLAKRCIMRALRSPPAVSFGGALPR